jgi:hypothetical protein
MSMPEMMALKADDPIMIAWNAYKATDDFKNSLMWATVTRYTDTGSQHFTHDEPANQISNVQREQHATGSLWAAFVAGFHYGRAPLVANPATVAELDAILNSEEGIPITINPDGTVTPVKSQ